MQATTIKLDPKLHSSLRRMKQSRLMDTVGLLSLADLAKLERGVGEYLSDGGQQAL